MVFQILPSVASAFGCLRRIEGYLNQKSRIDTRQVNPEVAGSPERDSHTADSSDTISSDTSTSGTEAITVRNATFGWTEEKDVLCNISCAFKQFHLTMIVGPVASGKSSLCKALLGEISFVKGSVMFSRALTEIAFCDQTAWLINGSVQKNILGFSNFDGPWYNAVINAVALNHDLSTFPDGDETIIGSGGITLSGGQKQRVAIARAVYARKKIAIFDDVFSGLDSTTEKHVFDHVFGRLGLLKRNGCTVILSTHTISHLSSADHIIALGKDGKIVEQGTFAVLNSAAEGYIRSLAVQESVEDESAKEMAKEATEFLLSAPKPVQVLESAKDDKSRQLGDFTIYRYYFRIVGTSNTVLFLIWSAGFSSAIALPSLWLKFWADANIDHRDIKQDLFYWGVFTGVGATGMVALYLNATQVFVKIFVKVGTALHWTLLRTVMSAPMLFFSQTDPGITTNRFSQDMELIDGELPGSLLNLATHIIQSFLQAILIAISSWYVALSYPFLICIFYLVQKFYLRTSRQLRFMDIEAKSPL